MSVRRAQLADAAAIARVHVVSWQAAYKDLLPAGLLANLSAAGRERNWRHILQDAAQAVFVYENLGGVVAFTNLGPCRDEDKDPETTAELMTLYALPGVWGRGVGRALWQADLAELREHDYREVTLWVLDGNDRALRFYRAAGFEADGVSKTETRQQNVTILEHRLVRSV